MIAERDTESSRFGALRLPIDPATLEKAGIEMLYETDFFAWTQATAQQLRSGNFEAIDMEELIDEVIDLGNRHKEQLESRLTILIAHLLKWDHQPQRRSNSWRGTIRLQRNRIQRLLLKMPSLRASIPEVLPEAYEDALALAVQETSLEETTFPAVCPYTLDEILSREVA